ncbi:hypothetical protein KKC16_00095, partial [Patescibacteria group bacterium]|nr:hypothetical protein [Patescibacteria group bacterium]
MKKLIIFLMMSLVFVGNSSAQKLKKHTYKCTFELGSAKVSKHDKTMLLCLADTLKKYDYLVSTFLVSTDYHKFLTTNDAKNGGLKIERITAVGRAMCLDEVKMKDVSIDTCLSSRYVMVSLEPDLQKILAMKQEKEAQIRTKADTEHDLRLDKHDEKFSQIEKRLDAKEDFYRFEVGNGLVAIKYSHIKWKAMPSLKLTWNLTPVFGLQAEGGTVPVGNFNNEPTWDGVLHTAAFWRPLSFVKILAGYSLSANFYESDFAIAESRDDAFLIGAELNAQMSEKVKIYISGSWVRSNVDGFSVSVGV